MRKVEQFQATLGLPRPTLRRLQHELTGTVDQLHSFAGRDLPYPFACPTPIASSHSRSYGCGRVGTRLACPRSERSVAAS